MKLFGTYCKFFVCPVWNFGKEVRSFGREVYYMFGPFRLVIYH